MSAPKTLTCSIFIQWFKYYLCTYVCVLF